MKTYKQKTKVVKFWGQPVLVNGDTWQIEIRKPIYGNCVALNGKLIEAAIKAHAKLEIHTPDFQETVDAKTYKEQSQRFEKVYLIPERPMVFYQRTLRSNK